MADMRSRSTAIASTVVTLAVLVAPASAAETKHGSCARFGAAFAAWAHSGAGVVGDGMSGLARSEPGAAAAAIEHEKFVDLAGTGPACDL